MYSTVEVSGDILPSAEISEKLRLLFENKNMKNVASHMRLKNFVIGASLNSKHYTILNDNDTVVYIFKHYKRLLHKYFNSDDNVVYKIKR